MHASAFSCNCMHYSTRTDTQETICCRDGSTALPTSGPQPRTSFSKDRRAFISEQPVDSRPLTQHLGAPVPTHHQSPVAHHVPSERAASRERVFFCPRGTPLDPEAASLAFLDMPRRSSSIFFLIFIIIITIILLFSSPFYVIPLLLISFAIVFSTYPPLF